MDLERINELGFEKTSKWMTIVLIVAFSKWWNFLISFQCYIVFLLCSWALAYHHTNSNISITLYTFDVFYLIEIIFTISYRSNVTYQKLRFANRSWFLIIIDVLSVIPFEFFYTFHYQSIDKEMFDLMVTILIQNRLLRIYRIFQLEYLYGITVRKYGQYVLFMFLLFLSKAFLIAHVLSCIWMNIKQSVPCDSKKYLCFVWYEANMAQIVILNWNGQAATFTRDNERLLVTAGLFSGILLLYAYFFPLIMLVSLQLNQSQTYYYDRYKKLIRFLQNMMRNSDARKRILANFLDAWRSTIDVQPTLGNVPLAMRKEIFTDIYWDAFRHSEVLRAVTRSCKRSLSLMMTTNFYHSGEVIYLKGQMKDNMLYLVQGIVQVMAEENENSPLLSFSSGTVFGELSMFLCTQSQAIVKCMSYCEFQTLSLPAVVKVLRDYPKDRQYVLKRLRQRILMAQYTQWRKNEFRLKNQGTFGVDSTVEDCVKWIKTQWSAVWERQKRQQLIIKALEEGERIPAFHRAPQPDIKIEFVSNYLELIVLSDAYEEKRDAVCIRTTFPWSIDPSASFLKIWHKFVILMCFVPNILYPVCTAWLPKFPRLVYEFSFILTGIFEVDVILKLFTAVKTKHVVHTRFTDVLRHRLRELTFYLDILAAFPYQMLIMFREDELETYQIGLFLHPALLKSHVLVTLPVRLGSNMDKVTFLKNFIMLMFLVYWLSELIQLQFVRTQKNDSGDTWINRFLKGRESAVLRNYFISVIDALTTSLGIPDFLIYPEKTSTIILVCVFKYFFFFFLCYTISNVYRSYMIRIFSQETFLVLLRRIVKFLNSVQLNRKLAERLLKTVKFQWYYDNADYLSSEVPIIEATSFELRNQIYTETVYKTLRRCKMFESETMDCITAVMNKSFIVAVPAGSLLVSYGHTSHMVSILHRGVCQINSFLEKDTNAGIGWPIIANPGTAFPLLSSFCNIPAPVGVVSITDSELIMIHLDDLLKIFIDFNILKDVLDVLKELDLLEKLTEVKPGLVVFRDKANRVEKLKEAKHGFLRFFVSMVNLFFGGRRFSDMRFVRVWDGGFAIYLMFLTVMWPNCFGVLAYWSHILLPVLIFTKLAILFNFLIGFRSPYYNRIGIMVTHPLYTFFNYLSTSFAIDLVCFFPFYEVYRYAFVDSMTPPPFWVVLISFAQLFLKVIHFMGYLDQLTFVVDSTYAIRLIKIIVSVLIAFNIFINLMMYSLADWIYGSPYKVIGFVVPAKYRPDNPSLLRQNNLVDYYIFIYYWMLCNLNTTDFSLNLSKDTLLYAGYALNVIGNILHLYIYCWMASSSFFTYLGETIFQERITSFVKFLEMENANDKIIERALSYYNNEWSITRGENLKKIFERLPTHLHEELVYPLYRATLRKSDVFSHADEGFYKILSKYITSVNFNRGSVIIFQNEVQSDLYFLHKGLCFVYDWFVKLDTGSLIGDLKRTGIMENKIYALTNVEMLRISSNDFFMVINNFDHLEANFFKTVKTLESFLRCSNPVHAFELHPADSIDVLNAFGLQEKVIGFEDESFFEETGKSPMFTRKRLKYTVEDKKRLFTIYPNTWKMKAFMLLLQVDAYLTLILLLLLASFGTLTAEAFFLIGVLDFFWLLSMVLSFRTGYIDKVKGDVVTDFKFVARHYLRRWDGFFFDLLALFPFEAIYLISVRDLKKADPFWVSVLRSPRLLRVLSLVKGIQRVSEKLKTNHYLRYANVVLFMVLGTIVNASITIMLGTGPTFKKAKDPYVFSKEQFFILVQSCEHVSRDTSPILINRVLDYKFNLLEFGRSENMPLFLVKSPTSLRINIMKDIYFSHLRNCPLFDNVSNKFLEQLLARMTREIYFSGQVIVDQYDVDHRMYFIHKGEIYVISPTKDKAYIEIVVGKMFNGQYFGEASGLWFSRPHSYTYRARTWVEVVVLHSDDWMDLRRSFPKTAELILNKAKELKII